jgi:endoglucanase
MIPPMAHDERDRPCFGMLLGSTPAVDFLLQYPLGVTLNRVQTADIGCEGAAGVTRRARAVPVVLVVFLFLVAACTSRSSEASPAPAGGDAAARTAAAEFLARYVDPDGRVVRRDQGGDTVSEGQAYALLLAQVSGDEELFARIWGWTAEHLQGPDGLLAFRADADRVLDPSPAGDADVLAAWALLRAGEEYREEGLSLAAAVLDREVVAVPGVGPVLAAGPWATGSPATLNPSYWTPAVFSDLARRTGDPRWAELAASALLLATTLTDGGRLLPPDWARVDGAAVTPTPAPGGAVPEVRYGLDAQRLPVWLATGCEAASRDLAARAFPVLGLPGRADALALTPTGEVLDADDGALPLVATAAAAAAAGRPDARDDYLERAAFVEDRYPGYYGAAWVALGRALLTTDLLDACTAP